MIEQDDAPSGMEGGESLRDSLSAAFDVPPTAADPVGEPIAATLRDAPAEPGDVSAEPAARAVTAPQAWSAAAKARWAELPPELQQEIARREGDFTRGIEQKVLEARRHYAPLEQVIGPRREAWARQFGSPERGLQTLVEISEQAGRDPEGFVRWFAQNSGLDLSRLAQGVANGAPADTASGGAKPADQGDPRVALLAQQVGQLQEYLAGEQQARQVENLSSLASVVDAFRADPKHEHFDAVAPDVLALIPVVRQAMPQASAPELLKAAYERTIWGDPGIRERLLAKQTAALGQQSAAREDLLKGGQERQQQDAAQDAHAARRTQAAAFSLTGAPPAGSRPSAAFPSSTLREELERQFASGRF